MVGGIADLTAAAAAVVSVAALFVAHRNARRVSAEPLTEIVGDVPTIHPEMEAAADRKKVSGGRKPKGNRPPGTHTSHLRTRDAGATNG